MRREIKFRGKRSDNGEWVIGNLHIPNKMFTGAFICPDTTYGDLLPGFEDGDDPKEWEGHGIAIGHFHRVNADTVCQFTGLRDKKGYEIYEGDVVRSFKKEYEDTPTINEVFFRSGSWKLVAIGEGKLDFPLFNYQPADLEIIGNIYENPELLS